MVHFDADSRAHESHSVEHVHGTPRFIHAVHDGRSVRLGETVDFGGSCDVALLHSSDVLEEGLQVCRCRCWVQILNVDYSLGEVGNGGARGGWLVGPWFAWVESREGVSWAIV
jgi:hypothetical protein